jgi:hypothetical protein
MELKVMNKEILTEAIQNFQDDIFDGNFNSNKEVSVKLMAIMDLVPNAIFSDIFFHGDRERSPVEMAEECLLREAIFSESGQEALDAHIIQQYEETMRNPESTSAQISSAVQNLEHYAGKELPEYREILFRT